MTDRINAEEDEMWPSEHETEPTVTDEEKDVKTMEDRIAQAKAEIDAEDQARVEERRRWAEKNRNKPDRSKLPSEHPDHVHGMWCDGQDGGTSYCMRLRAKLGLR